jgi:hypothetical protein
VIGIDIGKNSFHIVGLDRPGAVVLRPDAVGAPKAPKGFTRPPVRSEQKRFLELANIAASAGACHPVAGQCLHSASRFIAIQHFHN